MNRRPNSSLLRTLFALPLLIVLAGAAVPAGAGMLGLDTERVLNFHSQVTVRQNGSLLVHERIEINALGVSIQNTVTREFLASGPAHPAPMITVQEVTMDDKPAPFHVEEAGSTRRIIIGDADQPLLTGVHIYSLLYETDPQVFEIDGRDRLTWNATGSNWNLPIDNVTAAIEFPKGLPVEEARVEASAGGTGPRSKRYTFDFDTPGAVTFAAQALARDQALTVYLDWPLGHVRHRSWGIPLVMMEHRGVFVGLAGLAVLLLYWGVLWLYYGRTPKVARVTPTTTAPIGVSAVGLRYLKQRSTDSKMFTVLLISLARAGVITIEESDGNYALHRTTADFHSLAPEERDSAKVLFRSHESVSLKVSPIPVKNAVRALRRSLVRNYDKAFTPVTAFAVPAIVITAITVLVGMFFEIYTTIREELLPTLLLLLVFAVSVTALRQIWPASLKEWKRDPRESHVPGATGPNRPQMFTAILLGVMVIGVTILLGTKVSFLWALLLAAQTAVSVWFMKLMRVPTPRGHRLLDDLEGFRFQLRKLAAESTFSAEFGDERQATFEEHMHYALALDLEKDWIHRVDRAPDEQQYCPSWYTGEHFTDFYLRKSLAPTTALPGLEGLETIAGGRFIPR